MNYAIDRRRLAAVRHELPTEAYVPPGLLGASKATVYGLSPNRARARALARGFRGKVVLYTCKSPDCATAAQIVKSNLAPVGLSVKIVQLDDPDGAAFKPGAPYDMLLTGWFFDWADPSEVLNAFLDPTGLPAELGAADARDPEPRIAVSSSERRCFAGRRVTPLIAGWA